MAVDCLGMYRNALDCPELCLPEVVDVFDCAGLPSRV